ncbi:MAG: type IV secretion system protein [Pseudomonadota bacterium]
MTTQGCPVPDEIGLVANLLADVDCQAFGLVERGYAALSAPGGATATTLTAMMVIAVAFFGYQLMLGRGLVLADLTNLVVRIGVVLLLAAAWGTMQGAAYDTLARAPTRIAEDLITAIDAPSPLAGVQQTLDTIEQASVGWRQRAGIASPFVGGPPATAMALNTTGFLLTITTLGLLVVSRVVLALLLAITPVIAGFLLFDTTRGLVEGWLKGLVTAALVPVGVLTLTAVELAIMTPLLDRIIAEQASGQYFEKSVTPLGLIAIVFSIAIVASLAALRSIARGIRLPGSRNAAERSGRTEAAPTMVADRGDLHSIAGHRSGHRPNVVRALEMAQRREADVPARAVSFSRARDTAPVQSAAVRQALPLPPRYEPAYREVTPLRPRLRNRASRAAKRRDV